jgi:asparagine synthetase B (glutamine-hydrolysing)
MNGSCIARSRALTGLMTRRGLSFSTLTTHGDVGNFDDPDCARLVADELQLANTYIPLPPDYLARYWREKCLVTDFSTTMHTWLWPIIQHQGFSGAVNMDGVAGDTMLNARMLRPEHLPLLDQRNEDGLVEALWLHHGVGDALQRCLIPVVSAEWRDRARYSLRKALMQWDWHVNTLTFFQLSHRTRRAIAASPCLLLEQRYRNVAPFLDRDFAQLAMAIPPHHKLSGDLYRRVLRAIQPGLEVIPSSNDKEWPATFPRRRRPVVATDALQSYRDEVHRAADRLSGFVRPEFLTGKPLPDSLRPSSAMAELRLFQALGELAFWMNEYDVG